MSDLLIENIRLPSGDPASLLIRAGRIESIGANLTAPADIARVEGRGLLALPGCIDMHVHFRTPGGEHKETLLTGAAAAVKGGTTTCADMPNTSPPTTTMAALEDKLARAEGARANLLINFGAEPDNLEEVRRAVVHPAVKALKIYIGPSTGVGGLAPQAVENHMRLAGELGLPVMVHAEDMEIIAANDAAFPHEVRHHSDLRSLEAELSAVRHALGLAESYGTKLYLAHVTSAKVLDLAEDSGLGEQLLVEVCPHHLLLSTGHIAGPVENRYKVNPPLRDEQERAALFAELDGRIGCLGSDHAPHTLEEKRHPYDQAPSGIPGVEYMLPFALTWWREGRISLERMIAITSGNAARFFGLNKGALEPGLDGDLVLVHPEQSWTIGESDQVASKCGWTPYAGMALRGRPLITIVGGRVVHGEGS
ncbi:MAG: dihydroorotase family protein [SAR324 cluster bacterium]|nr:dihydroorotase family protein [SAR324 cluster bacterium]